MILLPDEAEATLPPLVRATRAYVAETNEVARCPNGSINQEPKSA